jgi:uncharacterized protein Usg
MAQDYDIATNFKKLLTFLDIDIVLVETPFHDNTDIRTHIHIAAMTSSSEIHVQEVLNNLVK